MSSTATRAERRTLTVPARLTVERRRGAEGPMRVRGEAITFGVWTELFPGVMERIAPGAADNALAAASDLLLVWSHDLGEPLAKRGRNMRVSVDSRALRFEADLPATQRARDVAALIDSGVLAGCSFAFTIADEDVEQRDGVTWFTVRELGRLFELTLTAAPAYESTSVEEARGTRPSDVLLREIRARRAAMRVSERSAYGPTSQHSFFRDLATVDEARRNAQALIEGGVRPPGPGALLEYGPGPMSRVHGDLEAALRRLGPLGEQLRDIGTSALSAEVDTQTGVPEFIVQTLGEGVRAHAVLATALEQAPLPPGFIAPASWNQTSYVSTPAVANPAATETAGATSTDIAGTAVALKPAMIDGQATLSRVLVDRAIGVDVLIAREIGGAIGAALESQVVTGSGSSGQMMGIANIANAVAVSYTDGTPTQAELWPFLWQTWSKVAASGRTPAIVAFHPRRFAWLRAAIDTANNWAAFEEALDADDTDDMQRFMSLGIPTTNGAGTNEDIVLVLTRESLVLASQPERLLVTDQTPEKLTFAGWRFAALVARQPAGVGVLSGTGLTAPTGY